MPELSPPPREDIVLAPPQPRSEPPSPRHGPPRPQRPLPEMKIGVVTEIKTHEYRVAATPAGVDELVKNGHQVLVQSGAGEGSGLGDE